MVCANSYFASVSTAKELMRLGMRFIGVVNTTSKQFPMVYLQALEFDKRGDTEANYESSQTREWF